MHNQGRTLLNKPAHKYPEKVRSLSTQKYLHVGARVHASYTQMTALPQRQCVDSCDTHLSRSAAAAFAVQSLHLSFSSAIFPSRSLVSWLALNDSAVRRFLRHSLHASVPAQLPPTASIFCWPVCVRGMPRVCVMRERNITETYR